MIIVCAVIYLIIAFYLLDILIMRGMWKKEGSWISAPDYRSRRAASPETCI